MYPFFIQIGGFVFIFPNKNNIILKNGKNFNKEAFKNQLIENRG